MALFVASAFVGNAGAQTDVTSTYLKNADFSEGTIITPGVCTYEKDKASNNTTFANLVDVTSWTAVESADGKAGGLFAIGGGAWLGGNHDSRKAPATNSDGDIEGNVLGVVSCWGATANYTQELKASLPTGIYTLVLGVYNSGSPKALSSLTTNVTGFVAENGTTYYASTKNYPVGQWKYEFIKIEVSEETSGKISIGYKGDGSSNNLPHLFFSGLTLFEGEVDAAAYEAAKAAARAKGEWQAAVNAANEALESDTYKNVTGEERANLQSEIVKEEPTDADGYATARDAVNEALNTFKNAATSYNALVNNCEIASQYNLAYASEESKTALDDACNVQQQPTNATDAATKANDVIKALRAYIESHGMAEGVVNAADMTSRITNASEPTDNKGWTTSGGMNSPHSNEPWTDANGNSTHSYFDGGSWGNTSWTTTMEQDITIPAGRYLLTAIGRSSEAVSFAMSVGDVEVNLPNVGSTGNIFDRGWNDASLEFITPGEAKEETVTITIKASTNAQYQWFSIGRFRLVQLEATEIPNATEEEYAALASAIEEAEQYTLGFEKNEYAPYINVEALTALATAKAINVNEENTSEFVNKTTAALNNAVWIANTDEVNAVANEHFATPSDPAAASFYLTGWIRTNNWGSWREDVKTEQGTGYYNQPGSLQYGNSTLTGYTMPLKANTVYNLSFKYGSWEGNSVTITASVLNDANEGLSAVSSDATSAKYSEVMQEKTFAFKTGAAGNYVLTLANNANAVITDVVIKQAPVVEATMSISDAKYSTFIAPFDVELPADVTASKITGVAENGSTLIEEPVEGTIPANTPVLLYSESALTQTFYGQSTATADTYTEGLLTGVYVNTEVPVGSYVLLNKNNQVGFYEVVDAIPTVKPSRCYLTVTGSTAPMFSLERGEGTTSIEDAELTIDNVVIYDLAGRRIEKMERGIYIVNGKKVIR